MAKASFNSIRPTFSIPMPARWSAFRVAGIGPRPIVRGSTPAAAEETIRTSDGRPSSRALRSLIRRTAAAPSLMPLAFPAVTVPPSRNAGRSFASASRDVSARGGSSLETVRPSPAVEGSGTGTISSANFPDSIAAIARRWLSKANRSCSSRENVGFPSRRFSAVSPMASFPYCAFSRGFGNRHPRVVSHAVRFPIPPSRFFGIA